MFACLKARPIRRGMQLVAVMMGLLPLTQAAQATTANSSFTVQVTIAATCTVNSAATLNFSSSQGLLTANVDQQSDIQVTCTNTTPYTVGLDQGTASGATVTTRKMTNGGNTISYSLYRDSARTLNWGNTPSTDTVSGTGTSAAITHTVYGRIPPQSTPAPATYTDLINVTVTY